LANNPLLGDANILLWKKLAYENKQCFLWVRPDYKIGQGLNFEAVKHSTVQVTRLPL
jgi:hypothetical protein